MASKNIKGITIEINGDVTKLDKALASVDKDLNTTQKNLKEVERLLKLDPKNVELLDQKQRLLSKAVEETEKRYDTLKKTLSDATASNVQAEKWAEAQQQFQIEITQTENALSRLLGEQQRMEGLKFAPDGAEMTDLQSKIDATRQKSEDLRRQSAETFEELGRPISVEQYDALQRELVQAKYDMDEATKAAKDFENGTEELSEGLGNVDGAASSLNDILGKLGISMKDLTMAGVVGLAVVAIKELSEWTSQAVTDAAEYADNILTLSTNFGISVEKLQEYQYMSELIDTDMNTITGSISKLTKAMDKARDGNDSATAAFNALNVSITDQYGRLRDSSEVFEEIIEKLHFLKDGTERDTIVMELFGRSAMDLNSLIAAGADGISAYAEEARRMGYVLTDEELSALGEVDDGFQKLDKAMEAAKNRIAIQLAPQIVELTKRMLDLLESTDWESFGRSIKIVIESVVPLITNLAIAIKETADAISSLIQWLDNLTKKENNSTLMSGYNNRRGGHGSRQVGIPAYADGGVVAPNNPMLAVVGDNRTEREVISPESLIRQIVREEARGFGGERVQVLVRYPSTTDNQIVRELTPEIDVRTAQRGLVL